MNWTEDQSKVIGARNCNLLVSAAAGSGKTAVLVERIIQKISDNSNPVNVDELLVVTFTKAAASQMKEKIRRAIELSLEDNPRNEHMQRQLHLVQQANILTIDSFCLRVVKEYFHVLGVDPAVRVGEKGELALLRSEVMDSVIEEFYEKNPDFVSFADAYCADKNDDRLEDYIGRVYDVSSSYPRPYEWTGDARRELNVETEKEFMELSYVREYMEQLRQTVAGIREEILSLLAEVRMPDGPLYMERALLSDIEYMDSIISARDYSTLHDLFREKFANIGRGKKGTYDEDAADFVKQTRDRYKKKIDAFRKVFQVPTGRMLGQLAAGAGKLTALLDAADCFRERFLEAKLQKNILEFSDVEHLALKALCDGYDESGEPVQSTVGRELSDGFVEILIDEYQDSNYLQEDILRCVSKRSQGIDNIFMVGDVKQSIYSFRMARPDLFMDKFDNYSMCDTAAERKLLLKSNFRSRHNILQGINYIFYQIMGRDLGGIEYTAEQELVTGREYPPCDGDEVELLIGESKDFVFVSPDDTEMTTEKEENLNQSLEDIGRMELEATIVSKRILGLLGWNGETPYQVTDDDTGRLRDVRLSDIVLLFRAPKSYAQIFCEVLARSGIAVSVQSDTGYLDTTEIHQILSLLRTVDNNQNEVELVASLRGYFGGFSNDDLARLVLHQRQMMREDNRACSLYQALINLADGEKSALADKCGRFASFLSMVNNKLHDDSLSELVSSICYESGYYYYVEAMPDGKRRARNLRLFLEEIRSFENSSYHSLFEFLRYIDRIISREIVLDGDGSGQSEEDMVRIMSIHKSKGLEFPVVFLCGMGKSFNLSDSREALIVHPDYHISAKYVDEVKRCGNDTYSRRVFASLMKMESVAEELRIFYVGLTRAKEKLILTGVVPDIPKLVRQYDFIAKRKEVKLGFSVVGTALSYMDLTVAALIRNPVFYDAMCGVKARLDAKKNRITADYEKHVILREPEFLLAVHVYDFWSISVAHIETGLEVESKRDNRIEMWEQAQSRYADKIDAALSFRYPYREMTSQKSKMSVTEIKRMYEPPREVDLEAGEVLLPAYTEHYVAPLPAFMETEQKLSAAMRGTLVHKALELFDFSAEHTAATVEEWMREIIAQGRVPASVGDILTVDNMLRLAESPLGKRMRESARNGLLFKEKKFVIGVSPKKLLSEEFDDEQQPVVVQGIIDVFFEEKGRLVLVDYKTDRIRENQTEELKQRYKTQLMYYRDTLEQLTGKEVAETYIYSLALDRELRIF